MLLGLCPQLRSLLDSVSLVWICGGGQTGCGPPPCVSLSHGLSAATSPLRGTGVCTARCAGGLGIVIPKIRLLLPPGDSDGSTESPPAPNA